jgi:protein tyrosine phosphatase (PTP) superfamily phosphohydrolase (DUF442 family)
MTRMRIRNAAALAAALALNFGAAQLCYSADSGTPASADPPSLKDDKPRNLAGLHNVVAYHGGFFSGSVPEGQAGFDTLAALGVKTIISVDGAVPDVAAARQRGIRYIHLPIGYNGFDEARKLQLARATRDAFRDGPVYIHCHHGKHRSAGAAGTIAVSLGWATPEEMTQRMKVSGTAPDYKGLYSCTAAATPLAAVALEAVDADFPEISRPAGFVKGMVEVDEIFEHLKAIETAGWKTPPDHPDLVPAAEAGRMADAFRLLHDTDFVRRKPAEFAVLMQECGAYAQSLEDGMTAGAPDVPKLSQQFKLMSASCKNCHVKYRD